MVRIRLGKLAVVALAGVTLLAAAPASATGWSRVKVVSNVQVLSDLAPATADPTDGARAAALAISNDGNGTVVIFALSGLDRAAAGMTHGAHVHVGPCEAGVPAAAGPHYNSVGGITVNDETEMWLDFTIRSSTTAMAIARVPFVIPAGGAKSIVVHAMATSSDGTAGPRLACLPLAF